MRVGFITSEFVTEKLYDGGLSNYVFRAALSLKLTGHEPVVFVLSDRNEKTIHEGIEVVRVQTIWTERAKQFNIRTMKKYRLGIQWIMDSYCINKVIEDYHHKRKLDILQYSSWNALSIFASCKIPYCLRVSSFQKELDKVDGTYYPDYQFLEELVLRKAPVIFSPSRIVAGFIKKYLQRKCTIIESPFISDVNQTDQEFADQVKDKTEGRPYLLYFGSMYALKGVLELLNALPEILEEFRELTMVFVGKDALIEGTLFTQFIEAYDGPGKERIFFFKAVPHNLLYPVIKNAHLVVLPSRMDNFPNTAIEAMAFGRIVVGTNGTSFEQLITNGVNGFLCRRNDPHDLKRVIRKALMINEEERENIDRNARVRIGELDPFRIAGQHVELYRNTILNFKSVRLKFSHFFMKLFIFNYFQKFNIFRME